MAENDFATHLMVALPCEAKPLIARYGLKRLLGVRPYSIYERGGVRLTVSGVGKTAMAAATAYTQAFFDAPEGSVWLNVGVAGRGTSPLGEAFVAEKISDADSGRCWYPPLIVEFPCRSLEVRTVSRPESGYSENCLYDMEASAFYETVCRFTTSELVQCVKIVSDNIASPQNTIEPRGVERWVAGTLELIDAIQDRLGEVALPLGEAQGPCVDRFTARWRFTSQQRERLRRLIRRWELVVPGSVPEAESLSVLKSATDVLNWLEKQLAHLPFSLS